MRTELTALLVALLLLLPINNAVAQTSHNWKVIDCAESEIALANYTECRMTDLYAGQALGNAGGQFYSQWAGYTGPDVLIYVYLQKGKHAASSMITTPETREGVLTKPTAKVGSEGRNFSGTIRVSGGYIKKFTMADWQCFSFAKDAPYAQHGMGTEYWMFGYSCGKSAAWQDDIKAGEFLTKLSLRKPRS